MKYIFYTFLFLFLPFYAFSAEIAFDIEKNSFGVNEEFVVKVLLDTENQNINGLEGEIVFSNDDLSVKDIRFGDSSINFWVDGPKVSKNIISFSGITPGGIIGSNKQLFSIVFKTVKPDNTQIDFKNLKVALNDGNGTLVNPRANAVVLSIGERGSNSTIPDFEDKEIPEDFIPIVSQSEDLFEGQKFVVFQTQDKLSGIDYYEIKEGIFGKFVKSESPYKLTKKIDKTIYIKAVDKSGNERIVKISQFPSKFYWYIFGILSIIVLLIFMKRKFYV